MREKLNNNPIAQVVIVLVLIAAAGFFFLGGTGGEEGEAPPTEATVTVAGTGATGTAVGAGPGEAVEGAVEGALEAAGAEASTAALAGAIPTPPLPRPVSAAYADGKTVVLLVVHDGGIDDRLVAKTMKDLKSRSEVAAFIVPARQISRYAAITLGIDVNRVPALIVVRPRALSQGSPQASVTYGFQSPQAVVQAVEDASYDGPATSYHPE